MDTMKQFSPKLKTLREEAGLNQSQLANKLGVSRGSISFYENGDRIPDIEFLRKVSEYFDVSADWLLGISETQNPDMRVHKICEFTGLSEELVVFLMEKQGSITPKALDDGLLPDRIIGQTCPSTQAYALNKFLPPDKLFSFSYVLNGFSSKIEWLKRRAEFYQSELNDAMTNWDEYKFSYLRNECTKQYESIHGEFRFERFNAIEVLIGMLDSFLESEEIPERIDNVSYIMSETLKAVEEYMENQ